ncbi:E3 ubiquitin-protein ligase RSP5 [Leucoagaricus sp. SymC.cos]|nr:E3 ubiquitin-protein ligase RSP5 [Leucoagaricus sp. SymC.cos]
MRMPVGSCQITVRRPNIFKDAYAEITRLTLDDLKKKLIIKFEGENDRENSSTVLEFDREFFYLLFHELFNPSYNLPEHSVHDKYTLQINPASGAISEHLNYFKFLGRYLGLGIFHCYLFDAHFTVGFYKMILKKPALFDLPENVYDDLIWML